MKLFTTISGLHKRSLASKYLHFHFPQDFYIYDSPAQKVISELTGSVGKRIPNLTDHDPVYTRFYLRCHGLHQLLDAQLGRPLSMREFDKVVLAYSRSTVGTAPQ